MEKQFQEAGFRKLNNVSELTHFQFLLITQHANRYRVFGNKFEVVLDWRHYLLRKLWIKWLQYCEVQVYRWNKRKWYFVKITPRYEDTVDIDERRFPNPEEGERYTTLIKHYYECIDVNEPKQDKEKITKPFGREYQYLIDINEREFKPYKLIDNPLVIKYKDYIDTKDKDGEYSNPIQLGNSIPIKYLNYINTEKHEYGTPSQTTDPITIKYPDYINVKE